MQEAVPSVLGANAGLDHQSHETRDLFLENVINTSMEGILLALGSGSYLSVVAYNHLFRKFLELGERSLDGITLQDLTELIRTRISAQENDDNWSQIFSGIPGEPVVQELVLDHKEYRVLRLTASPAKNATNDTVGILMRVRDVTHDKNLEQQLLHSQKMEGLGTLAGGIAHDFNNLLTAILGYSSALKVDLGANQQALNKLDQIIRSSHRAADLTRNLLAFSRKNPHMPRVLDFNELVGNTVGMLEHAIRKPIHIELRLAPDLPNVSADPAQMTEAITQLALNARDAILGSGTIRFVTRVGHDNQSTEGAESNEFVVLDVEDDGIGIPKDYLSRIFEPFYTTKETAVGSGLGLSMVYGAVKQHYGFVEVESAPNLGSRFSIYLPATEREIENPKLSGLLVPVNEGIQNSTILVVDDEEDIRNLCEIALEDNYCKVITAEDGQKGVETFSKHANEIDLVILDMTMPKMDGKECFAKLQEIRKDAPVLISSGYSSDMDTDSMISKGALGFIEKPYSMTKLIGEIEKILAAKKHGNGTTNH